MLTPFVGAISEAMAVRLFTTVRLRTVENGEAWLIRRYTTPKTPRGPQRNAASRSSAR